MVKPFVYRCLPALGRGTRITFPQSSLLTSVDMTVDARYLYILFHTLTNTITASTSL